MFLDDKLFKMVHDSEVKTTSDIQNLYESVINECQNYFQTRIKQWMQSSEVKVIIDKSFNLYNSFVLQIKKTKDPYVKAFDKVFTKDKFKDEFMNTNEFREVYERL